MKDTSALDRLRELVGLSSPTPTAPTMQPPPRTKPPGGHARVARLTGGNRVTLPKVPTWNAHQRQMVDVIRAGLEDYEWSVPGLYRPETAAAWFIALVNAAWWETRLGVFSTTGGAKANVHGDGGEAVGLFQAHSRGAGKGYSVEYRMDPANNVRLILASAEMWERQNGSLSSALQYGTLRDFVATFNAEVERPGAHEGVVMPRESVGSMRSYMVDEWHGSNAADRPAWGWQPNVLLT